MASFLDRMRGRPAAGAQVKRAGAPRPLSDRYTGLIDDLEGYDAEDAARRTAQAQFEGIQTPLAESIERLRGEQVGQGRLNTGYGYRDQDTLYRDIYQNFTRQIAENSLAAQSLNLEGYGLRGDLLSGGLDREQLAANDKRKRKGGLLGALGGIAGGVLGSTVLPGIGTELGAYLGGKLGGAAGAYL